MKIINNSEINIYCAFRQIVKLAVLMGLVIGASAGAVLALYMHFFWN